MSSLEANDGPLPAPTTTRTLTPTTARSRSRRSNASTSSSRQSSRAVSLVRTAELAAFPPIGEPGPSGSFEGPSSLLATEVLPEATSGPSSSGAGADWSSGPLIEERQAQGEVAPEEQEADVVSGKGKKRKAAEVAIEDAIYGEGAARRRRGVNGKGKGVASDPVEDSAEEDIDSPVPSSHIAVASDSELLESALPPTTSLPVVPPTQAKVSANEPQYLHTYNCSVCLAPPKNATLIPCGHIFCGECLFTSVRIAMRNITPYGTTMARYVCRHCTRLETMDAYLGTDVRFVALIYPAGMGMVEVSSGSSPRR